MQRDYIIRIIQINFIYINYFHNIIGFIGARFHSNDFEPGLESLQSLRWLPCQERTDRFYSSTELYTDYRQHIFSSQALFLNLPRRILDKAKDFLESIGVKTNPKATLVVDHLLHLTEIGKPVHSDVYRFLNEEAEEESLFRLKGTACLCLGNE